jgi:PAS domain S-box-containing protein
VVDVNRTALEAAGVAREEVLGQYFWDTAWWRHSPEEQERVRQAVARAAQGELVHCDTRYQSRERGEVDVDVSVKPFRDGQGRVAYVLIEGRDISALKRAQRAETAMLRSLAAIGESAALLAHEIKNPITAVNLALRAVAGELGEDHRVVLEDLVQRLQRLESTMRRTLSFARPLQLACKPCDAGELARAAALHLAPEAAAAKSRVDVESDPRGVPLVADPGLLDEVLCNLIRNSLSAKGGAGRVLITVERDSEGGARIAVDDDGPGVPPALAADVFKPFVTGRRDGNGLGLALCRKIVMEHGGSIALAPARLGGARFEIRLPAAGPAGARCAQGRAG